MPTSFVKSNLQQVHSDLLFRAKTGGKAILFYLLFEHQSTVDPSMPLRAFGYIGEILNQHFKSHGLPLPPVIPFVLHQGPEEWTVSTAFEDLFEMPDEGAEELKEFLPKFRHALLDLSERDPASEESDPQLRIILHLMKAARQEQLQEYFRWLAGLVIGHIPNSLLARLLFYALHADSGLDAKTIFRNLSANPQLEKRAMSAAEKLRAEGREEGREEGFLIGNIQSLQKFLSQPQSSRTELESLDLAELKARLQSLDHEYEKRFKNR